MENTELLNDQCSIEGEGNAWLGLLLGIAMLALACSQLCAAELDLGVQGGLSQGLASCGQAEGWKEADSQVAGLWRVAPAHLLQRMHHPLRQPGHSD